MSKVRKQKQYFLKISSYSISYLYKITGKTMENSDIGITRDTYRQGYTLIGFDVDPTTSPDFRYVGKPREGHTKLEIRFKTVYLHQLLLFCMQPSLR